MRLGLGGVLCDDEPFSFGGSHAKGKFNLRDEVVAVYICESLPPFSECAWKAVSRALQESDC